LGLASQSLWHTPGDCHAGGQHPHAPPTTAQPPRLTPLPPLPPLLGQPSASSMPSPPAAAASALAASAAAFSAARPSSMRCFSRTCRDGSEVAGEEGVMPGGWRAHQLGHASPWSLKHGRQARCRTVNIVYNLAARATSSPAALRRPSTRLPRQRRAQQGQRLARA